MAPAREPSRRGKITYLRRRSGETPPWDRRPNLQEDSTAATLLFQRWVHSFKQNLVVRNKRTPRGVNIASWDRTEEQTRKALHLHILTRNKRRKITQADYKPRPPPTKKGNRVCNPADSKAALLNAEDVHTEPVRLDVSQDRAYPRWTLLWAFRCRALQTQLYIHACTPLYFLKNQSLLLPLLFSSGRSSRSSTGCRSW